MCGVVLVTAQDLQAITLAPVETPGCEGAVEPVCTLGYVSTLCQGHMCKWCTLGRGLRARLHEGQGRSCSPSLMVRADGGGGEAARQLPC